MSAYGADEILDGTRLRAGLAHGTCQDRLGAIGLTLPPALACKMRARCVQTVQHETAASGQPNTRGRR
jgi:hypothetical protein